MSSPSKKEEIDSSQDQVEEQLEEADNVEVTPDQDGDATPSETQPECEEAEDSAPKKKKTEPGLIYISYLPPDMTPLFVRTIFAKYGDVGRIYMQADTKQKGKTKAKYDRGSFTEGWIEMGDKKLARRLAMSFNNTLITDGKRTKFSNYLWNVKYLPRFRWTHLTERLAHEREKKNQMMQVEFAQAKKETSTYKSLVENSKKLASIQERKEKKGEVWKAPKKRKVRQRKTVEEMQAAKKRANGGKSNADEPRQKVLKSIFG